MVEDVHWVDAVSESMLVELMSALAGTSALVLITHRPEYRGALSRVAESEVIVLAPLDGSKVQR